MLNLWSEVLILKVDISIKTFRLAMLNLWSEVLILKVGISIKTFRLAVLNLWFEVNDLNHFDTHTSP